MQLTQNFVGREFECLCCGVQNISMNLVRMLQAARDIASISFEITSGYRCSRCNAEVGGTVNSSHMKGLAADIRTQTSLERFAIVNGLIRAGFERIGIGHNFIHVDIDGNKSQRIMWKY